ncbi:hypothetical protein SYJ56_22585 [Algoriphagus sp. D3-2-R+10]|nr:hypothetical protein [Algoriphagus sp. D3-2-R+10]MEB2778117.1 hypothetical protein [Algoriphagus sp. D3-2-R+10]
MREVISKEHFMIQGRPYDPTLPVGFKNPVILEMLSVQNSS